MGWARRRPPLQNRGARGAAGRAGGGGFGTVDCGGPLRSWFVDTERAGKNIEKYGISPFGSLLSIVFELFICFSK